MRKSTSRITGRSQKRYATYKPISLFIIRSDCTRHWTIGRQRRCISKASWAFLERLCFVLFLPSNCLDFWDHHRISHKVGGKLPPRFSSKNPCLSVPTTLLNLLKLLRTE